MGTCVTSVETERFEGEEVLDCNGAAAIDSHLPAEMIMEIFLFLDVGSILRARKSQSRWNTISRDDRLWKHLYFNDFGGPLDSEPASWEHHFITQYKQMKERSRYSEFEIALWAIRKGHIALLTKLIVYSGVNFNVEPESAESVPLHIAAHRGDKEIVELLLTKGHCSPNLESENVSSPLYIASQEGHLDVCKLLVKYGADIESRFRDEFTPLYIAAQRGRTEVVKFLIQVGADYDVTYYAGSSGSTPIYISAQEGKTEVIKALAEAGANIEVQFRGGFTPLYVASRNGHFDAVKYLLDLGANTAANDGDGSTSLYVSCQNGHYGIVDLLLRHRADPEIAFLGGYTPLYIAAQNGYSDVVRRLCDSNAMFLAHVRVITAGISVDVSSQNGHAESVSTLLDYGAEANVTYSNGYTPIYVASQKGHLSVVKVLVEKAKANVNTPTERGATPLYVACQRGHYEIAKYLIKHNADQELTFENGYTPLHIAVGENRANIVELLLKSGANPKIADNKGQTPLDLAMDLTKSPYLCSVIKNYWIED